MSKRKNDIILVVCILTVALIVLAVFILTRGEGSTVEVTLDGKHYDEFSLGTDAEIPLGDKENGAVLVIEDGCAYIKNATCDDKLCEKQGKISNDGETLVCLPNKIVVTVNSKSGDSADFTQ